jgi:hypothetical protein
MAGVFQNFVADYNLMAPEDMDELLFSPFEIALGEETVDRIQTQFENYEYYQGKQHKNENGELVRSEDLEQPAELDYEPTRYATNYFKAIIERKARWQMGGQHNVIVPRKQIDDPNEAMEPGYEPSSQQQRQDEIDEAYESLLHQLWDENKMRVRLLQAARDRLIADRVVCKIAFNQNTGKLRWIFRPDTEFIPVFSDDDFEELIACHFIRQKIVQDGDDEVEAFQKQTFSLEGEGEARQCYIEEAIYTADDLEVFEQVQPRSPMGIDFIPVVMFPVNDLLGETVAQSEVQGLREQNDVLNQLNEDAIDSIKFEMFSMTALLNVPEGTADSMEIAPGGVFEARGHDGGQSPSVQKIEGGFKWTNAFKDQYMRVKSAMHETASLPQFVPQEMNFGGLNGDTLQIMFHDIISDTEEHWIAWEFGLKELHEKSIKYLQARTGYPNFAYDSSIVNRIEDYTTEMKFALPLPDNRKELVELLGNEMANNVESQAGAMRRLGVEDVKSKQQEIINEQIKMMQMMNPYGAAGGGLGEGLGEEGGAMPSAGGGAGTLTPQAQALVDEGGQATNEDGEPIRLCSVCNGSGRVVNPEFGDFRTCENCKGDGIVQVRKR